MMSLFFVGCDKKPEPQKPTPGGTENPTPNPDPKPDPDPDPTPEGKSELPLLSFTENEEEIQKYETELGRKAETIQYGTQEFPGYANGDFKVIPAAVYLLEMQDGSAAILALGSETIDNPTKTLDMLREAGFDVEKKEGTDNAGNKMIGYWGENKEGVKVQITAREEAQFETNIQIIFAKVPEMTLNKNAKDFPSYEALKTKKVEEIEKFESTLGFREPYKEAEKLWDETKVNLVFLVKPEKLEANETNIGISYYACTPSEGPSFIGNEVKGITGSHLQSDEVKEWLALNGFDTDVEFHEQYALLSAFNKEKTIQCYLFASDATILLQIFNPAELNSSPAKMIAHAAKMAKRKNNVIRPILL